MPRRNMRGRKEMLSRTLEVVSFRTSVHLGAVAPRGEEPYIECQTWLELSGTMNEPVRDVLDVVINMYPKDKVEPGSVRPAAVGAVLQIRPHLDVVAAFPSVDFDRMLVLAIGGQLKHGNLCFTTPHRNKALVVSMSFSSEPEE